MIIQFTSDKSIAYLMSIFDSREVVNLQQQLAQFPRLDLAGTATPLEKLSRSPITSAAKSTLNVTMSPYGHGRQQAEKA